MTNTFTHGGGELCGAASVRNRGGAFIAAALGLLGIAACSSETQIAIIAVHAAGADEAYFSALSDSLGTQVPPIRIESFNPSANPRDSWSESLRVAEAVSALEGLVGVVGQRDSRSTLIVAPVYREAGIPVVVPNSTSSAINELGPAVFSLIPDAREQGALLAEAATDGLGARSVSVFAITDEYGLGLRDGVLAALPGSVEVLDVVEYGGTGRLCPQGYQPFVDASLLNGTPDVVILASRSRDAGCLAGLFQQRAPGIRFLGGDGVELTKDFLANAGPATDRFWFVRFWTDVENPGIRELGQRYEADSGAPMDAGAPLRIDGVRMLAEAVRQVGNDPEAVTHWLAGLGADRPPYPGVTGDISFAPGAQRPMFVTDASRNPVTWNQR